MLVLACMFDYLCVCACTQRGNNWRPWTLTSLTQSYLLFNKHSANILALQVWGTGIILDKRHIMTSMGSFIYLSLCELFTVVAIIFALFALFCLISKWTGSWLKPYLPLGFWSFCFQLMTWFLILSYIRSATFIYITSLPCRHLSLQWSFLDLFFMIFMIEIIKKLVLNNSTVTHP